MADQEEEKEIREEGERIKQKKRSPWSNISKPMMIIGVIGIILVVYMYNTEKLTSNQLFFVAVLIFGLWYLTGKKDIGVEDFITAKIAKRMLGDYCEEEKYRMNSGWSPNDVLIVSPQSGLNQIDTKPTSYFFNVIRTTTQGPIYYRGVVDAHIGNPQIERLIQKQQVVRNNK